MTTRSTVSVNETIQPGRREVSLLVSGRREVYTYSVDVHASVSGLAHMKWNITFPSPAPQGLTWGIAYELQGEAALQYLNQREAVLGGYTTDVVPFYPRY